MDSMLDKQKSDKSQRGSTYGTFQVNGPKFNHDHNGKFMHLVIMFPVILNYITIYLEYNIYIQQDYVVIINDHTVINIRFII